MGEKPSVENALFIAEISRLSTQAHIASAVAREFYSKNEDKAAQHITGELGRITLDIRKLSVAVADFVDGKQKEEPEEINPDPQDN